MGKPIQGYEAGGVKVTYDPNVCTHAAKCVKGLPQVFDVRRKPWITPEGASADEVEAQVGRCPSGALGFERK